MLERQDWKELESEWLRGGMGFVGEKMNSVLDMLSLKGTHGIESRMSYKQLEIKDWSVRD